MPHGKPAGMRCVQLDDDARCRIFGRPERPTVCASLRPSPAMCGDSRAHAMRWLAFMEQATQPSTPRRGRLAPQAQRRGATPHKGLGMADPRRSA